MRGGPPLAFKLCRVLDITMAGVLDLLYVALVFVVAVGGVFGVFLATRDATSDREGRLGLAVAVVVALFIVGAAWPLVT